MKRQVRRLEKAIDEIQKILDDGQGTDTLMRILELLNSEIAARQ